MKFLIVRYNKTTKKTEYLLDTAPLTWVTEQERAWKYTDINRVREDNELLKSCYTSMTVGILTIE